MDLPEFLEYYAGTLTSSPQFLPEKEAAGCCDVSDQGTIMHKLRKLLLQSYTHLAGTLGTAVNCSNHSFKEVALLKDFERCLG